MAVSFGAAWQVQYWRYDGKLAEIGEAQAIAITEAGNIARAEEQRRQAAVNKEANDAREQNKAADVDIAAFYGPPSETNFGGALLTGSQSACKAACDAFAQAVEVVASNPTAY